MEREQNMEIGQAGGRRGSLRPALDARELAAVFAGGVIGAGIRAALVEGFGQPAGTWPWPTFAVNIAGALLLGYLVTRLTERLPPSAYARALLASGLCGALTTFSTMILEVLQMLEDGYLLLAAGYTAATLGAGLAGVFAATKLVRRARPAG